ncbi:DNA polymerase III subunit alpha [Sodalis praecaptivus]
MTLEKAFVAEPQLQAIYDADEEVKALIDMARKLEGVTRNAGKHAGGVVIAPTKITDFAPLYCDAEGNHPVTQFDKNDVEYAGLVKFDFLGLRTLTIINWALEMINARRARQGLEPIDIAAIPLEDKKSFDMLQRSETTAVFQLESRGMKDLIKRLQPDCFEDMIALVALFRPGPLQSGMVDNFIDRKHGREAISYPDIEWQHASLQPVLEPTYGIILYQEQVMQIAQVLAGYTLGGADMLRRAMGKKKPEEMAKQRSVFKAGAESIGVDGELSMKLFDLVEKFAGYGFNKSHSAAYALVSYQTLWLKAHYPAEFMAAVMTADMDNTEKVVGLVDECLRMGLKVLPPDINSGQYHFHVNEEGEIVYGIGAIKGVGKALLKPLSRRAIRTAISVSCLICARAPISKSSIVACWKN